MLCSDLNTTKFSIATKSHAIVIPSGKTQNPTKIL